MAESVYGLHYELVEHGLLADPFLVGALIAVVRTILVLTDGGPQTAAGRRNSVLPRDHRVRFAGCDGVKYWWDR